MSLSRVASRAVLGLAFAATSIAQAPPTMARALEDLLPASSYACFRFGGLEACAKAADSTAVAEIVRSLLERLPAELRQQHVEGHLEQVTNQVQKQLQRVGVGVADLRVVLGRPMVLAIGRPTIEGMGPSVALVADIGPAGEAARRLLAAFEAIAAQEGHGAVTFADTDVDGVPMRAMNIHDGPTVVAGEVDGCLVITNSRRYLRDIAAVKAGKAPSLAKGSNLGAAAARLPVPALASLFLNTQPLMSILDPVLPYEATDLGRALGVSGLDSIYAGITGDAHGGADVLRIGLAGDEKGMLKALVSAPADLGFAARCSKNTVAFAVGNLDVLAVVDAFQRFAELLPAPARAELQRELPRDLARELRQLGTTPEAAQALLGSFGTQFGMAMSLEAGAMPKPELLFSLAVRNWQQVTPLLSRLEAMAAQQAGVEWKSRKAGERTIRFVDLPLPQANLQLSPCYVQTEDSLLIASDVAALLRALGQHKKPDDALAAQPDFATVAKRCAGASGVFHLRLFRAAELGWRTVETMAYPQIDAHKDQIGIDSEALPDAETIARALGTITWAAHVDTDAVILQNHGTVAFGAILAGLGRAVDEVLARAGRRIF
ncbi:MAG: hypothetical protein IPK26_21530 [Planctomycetes bacterium]|nr:hypothetical protein [Planctomycetota bacterium]